MKRDSSARRYRCRGKNSLAMIVSVILIVTNGALLAEDNLIDLFGDVTDDSLTEQAPAATTQFDDLRDDVTELVIEVSGVSNANGVVRVFAYDSQAGFKRVDPRLAIGYGDAPAARGTVEVRVKSVGSVPYAILAFHDENNDELFNTRGPRPSEGYGFSGAIEPFVPPPFSKAAVVEVGGQVRLHYLSSKMRR